MLASISSSIACCTGNSMKHSSSPQYFLHHQVCLSQLYLRLSMLINQQQLHCSTKLTLSQGSSPLQKDTENVTSECREPNVFVNKFDAHRVSENLSEIENNSEKFCRHSWKFAVSLDVSRCLDCCTFQEREGHGRVWLQDSDQ